MTTETKPPPSTIEEQELQVEEEEVEVERELTVNDIPNDSRNCGLNIISDIFIIYIMYI